jgi:hypothetical protein
MKRYPGTELFVSKRRFMAAQNEFNAHARAVAGGQRGTAAQRKRCKAWGQMLRTLPTPEHFEHVRWNR